MNRILNVATESHHFDGLSLSMEEADVVEQEARDSSDEISGELAESERVLSVSQSLEDMAEVIENSGTDETDATTASLVNVATDLAVAGSDIPPTELVPEPEAVEGQESVAVESRRYRISVESIGESARNLLNKIIAYVKQLWQKIKDFFYKIFGTIPNMRKKIEAARQAVEAAGSKSLESDRKKFKLTGLSSLELDGKVASSFGDVTKGLAGLHDAAKYVFGDYVNQTAKKGDQIKKALEDFDKDKTGEAVAKLQRDLVTSSQLKVPGASGSDAKRKPDFFTALGTPMLGGKSLMVSYSKDDSGSALASLDRMRRSGVELVATKDKKVDLPKEVEFSTLSTREMNALLDDAEKIIDIMDAYRKGAKSKELDKVQKEIETATSKAVKAADGAEDRGAINNFRSLAGFNVAFARWAHEPAAPLTGHVWTEIKAVIALVQKSCSQYK